MAVSASTPGNICTNMSSSRPVRRPRNRKRLNAYAAHAPISSAPPELTSEMSTELRIHLGNGY